FDLGSVLVWYGVPSTVALLQCVPVPGGPRIAGLSGPVRTACTGRYDSVWQTLLKSIMHQKSGVHKKINSTSN
ncbi:unnamed protein product, partial [Musa banksii]